MKKDLLSVRAFVILCAASAVSAFVWRFAGPAAAVTTWFAAVVAMNGFIST